MFVSELVCFSCPGWFKNKSTTNGNESWPCIHYASRTPTEPLRLPLDLGTPWGEVADIGGDGGRRMNGPGGPSKKSRKKWFLLVKSQGSSNKPICNCANSPGFVFFCNSDQPRIFCMKKTRRKPYWKEQWSEVHGLKLEALTAMPLLAWHFMNLALSRQVCSDGQPRPGRARNVSTAKMMHMLCL